MPSVTPQRESQWAGIREIHAFHLLGAVVVQGITTINHSRVHIGVTQNKEVVHVIRYLNACPSQMKRFR